MNRALAREIVNSLRVSGLPEGTFERLGALTGREWEKARLWLVESGLALYFCQRVKGSEAEAVVPADLLVRLARNLGDNQRRVAAMAEEFGSLNRCFERAGIEYAVLKGFALVPDYCPDACLRTQFDYDYLVRPESLKQAELALRMAGYRRKYSETPDRLLFIHPGRAPRLPSSEQDFFLHTLNRPVELHLSLWEFAEEKLSLETPADPLSRSIWRSWKGLRFPALSDPDALLAQGLHAFRHILNNECRLSLFYEMAHFLDTTRQSEAFWQNLRTHTQADPRLPEIIGVIFTLASELFGAEVSPAAAEWTTATLPRALALWTQRHGLASALDNFSSNKFSLLLHREFVEDTKAWREIRSKRLFPFRRPHRAAEATSPRLASHLAAAWRQGRHVLRRIRFHLVAAACYAWELPMWERLLREHKELSRLPAARKEETQAVGVSPARAER